MKNGRKEIQRQKGRRGCEEGENRGERGQGVGIVLVRGTMGGDEGEGVSEHGGQARGARRKMGRGDREKEEVGSWTSKGWKRGGGIVNKVEEKESQGGRWGRGGEGWGVRVVGRGGETVKENGRT